MSYQVLARKWRPHTFQQIIGQEHIVRILKNALELNRLHHAYLFTGTRGVGKTTLARLLAKCFNCEKGATATPCDTCKNCIAIDAGRFLDLLEIDAASRTKVEDTRELLENVHYQPAEGRYKVYLIDEVHMLSGHSFNALLKTLEEPPAYVKFLLATTDPKRLPITILSRCLQLNLKRVEASQIALHLQHICTSEKIAFEVPALNLLANAAEGSLRDALSLLDQTICYCNDHITQKETEQMLGSIEQEALFNLLQALFNQDGAQLLAEIKHLSEYAADFQLALEDLLTILHRISIAQVIKDAPDHSPDIEKFAQCFSHEEVQLYYQIALIGRRDLPLAPNPEQGFEMVLLRMLAFKPVNINNPPAAKKIISPIKIKTKTETAPTLMIDNYNWAQLLPQLELNGLAYVLAANCTLKAIIENKITLILSTQHSAMCNKKLIERVEQALTRVFKKPMQLDIALSTDEIDTPTKQQQKIKTDRADAAKEAIKNDEDVRKIVDLFNATIDINSITAL